jgi:hypothetical protein
LNTTDIKGAQIGTKSLGPFHETKRKDIRDVTNTLDIVGA